MTSTTPEIEALAAELGEQVYIDVAKWHLFLAEAHLHIPLAERVYPLLESDNLRRSGVEAILKQLSVAIGGGQSGNFLARCHSQPHYRSPDDGTRRLS